MLWLILLCFGLLVWLTFRLGAELFSPWVGVVAALVVLTRPALERDALLGYQDTAFACLIVGAVLLEARRRSTRRGGARAARARRPDAARGRGAGWPARHLDVAGGGRRAPAAAGGDGRRRAADLGALGPARDRRRAGPAARDGGPRRGSRPAPRHRRRALLDRAVLRLHAARAAGGRDPDRPVLRLALPPPRGDPAARRRGRDDARVHDRPGVRAPADRALRAHPVGAALAVLRARGVRLPAARRPPRAQPVPRRRDLHRRALDRVPALARRHARRPRAPARPRRAHVRGAAPGRPARRRCARRSTAAAAASPRRTTARCRTCATGWERTRARVGTVAPGREPAGRRADPAAPRPADAPLLPGELPARSRRRRATSEIYRNDAWRVLAAPGCVTRLRA